MLSYHKKATNTLLKSQKIQRKTGSAQQKMHRACFIPFSNTHSHSNFLRQYVLTKPLPFSKPAYIYAEIQPGYQCYL